MIHRTCVEFRQLFGAPRRCCTVLLLGLAVFVTSLRVARAGGGPENVIVVVNPESWASLTVANHFIQLRQIPDSNVFYIPWTGGIGTTSGEIFRQKLLIPMVELIDQRGLMGQIDYIVYSSDFPCAVDLIADFPKYTPSDIDRPTVSLNSATYMWNMVMLKVPMTTSLRSNQYMRRGLMFQPTPGGIPELIMRTTREPTIGFRSWYGWGASGELLEAGGNPYMLSTLLAVTSGRGNSVGEAVSYLQASATADGTQPTGTIYFSKTSNIRSTTRFEPNKAQPKAKPLVENPLTAVLADLKTLSVKAETISTPLPSGRNDVMGLATGEQVVQWSGSRSKILPGAICENFTSFGGVMSEGADQTPLTEFLKYGAAGSSGTVVEPLAMPEKFPSPNLFVHYARGCTLAEAFYQSVAGPGQLLIVGDPLCRPWANIPQVSVEGVRAGTAVSGVLELRATAKLPKPGQIEKFEMFLDGRRKGVARPGESLKLDTAAESDGFHELRIVAIEDGPIASQGRAILPLFFNNHQRRVDLTVAGNLRTARWDEPLTLRVRAPGASESRLHANGLELGKIKGEDGTLEINPRRLGLGPTRVHAVSIYGQPLVRSEAIPVELTIEPDRALPARANLADLRPGLLLRLKDGRVVQVQKTLDPAWLGGEGVRPQEPFTIEAVFSVPAEEVYQFQARYLGELKLTVDGRALLDGRDGDFSLQYAATNLARGAHQLTITGIAGAEAKLQILFGGPGAISLSAPAFSHVRPAAAPAGKNAAPAPGKSGK